MERRETKKIGTLLHHFLKSKGLERGYAEYRLKKSWKELLGVMVARKTRDLRIRNRTLIVTLDSSVVRQELEMMKDTLVQRLNDAAGMSVIDDIVLR
jgi:predicted nucleic acid-binding Zn ribbon protein